MKNYACIFLLPLLIIPFSNTSGQGNINADTSLANNYFKLAKRQIDSSHFDSAEYYIDKARALYVKHSGEKSLNYANILQLKGLEYDLTEKYDSALEYYLKTLQIRKDIIGEKHIDIAASYDDIGNVYNEKSDYDKSLEFFLKSLSIRNELRGEKDTLVAKTYLNIGDVYNNKADYDKALEYLFKSLSIQKELLGEKHADVASSYNEIGLVYWAKAENDRALEYYFKSLEIRKALFGEKHILVAQSYNNIGVVYDNKSEYDKALEYHFKSLEIRRKLLGENHTDVAASYNNIGTIYQEKSEYVKALEYFFKSLEILKKVLGDKHFNVAISYSNIGMVYDSKAEYDKALEYYFKCLDILKILFGEKHTSLALTYNNIGIVYSEKAEYEKALEYYGKALAIQKELFGEKHTDVAASYINFGQIYREKAEYDKALEYYFKSLVIQKELFGENHSLVATTYSNIGVAYDCKSEYDKALEYYNKGLSIRKKLFGEKHSDVALSYSNIGLVYEEKAEYDKALEYFFNSLSIRKELFGQKHTDVAYSYNEIGVCYHGKSENDTALKYYFKSLEIQKELLGEKHPAVAQSYNNIGVIYEEKHNYDKALEYYFKSLAIQRALFGEKHSDVALYYINIGGLFRRKKDLSTALKYYEKGMASCLYNFGDTINVYTTPIIAGYLDWKYLLRALRAKAEIIAKQSQLTSNPALLEISIKHYKACDSLIDLTRKEINTLSDKLALGEWASEIYQGAINVCEKLKANSQNLENQKKYDELAFYFSEKNRSTVLLEALAGHEAQKIAGIPDSLLQIEHKLKIDIAFFSKQLAQPENLSSAKLNLFQNSLFDSNRRYDSLIRLFETGFAKYFELKYNQKTSTVGDIQKLLDKHTAMISFVDGDSVMTIFIITRKSLNVKQKELPLNFKDTIQQLRASITQTGKSSKMNYLRLANTICNLLIPKNINKEIENLIIIPDNVLATIPFEALLTRRVPDSTEFSNLPYLAKDYNISYSYSATLFHRTFPKETKKIVELTPLNDWLAVAPVFSNESAKGMTLASRNLLSELKKINKDTAGLRSVLLTTGEYIPPLPGTESEVKSIFSQFDKINYKAKVVLEDKATEEFIKSGEPENYRILHFATHGFINNEEPELSGILLSQDSIGGQDGILYSGEIYNLKLHADLVVLSACETGLGKFKKGEGIIGLTRALLYAGTKNIIVSLWQVADLSTSALMLDFYKNLLGSGSPSSYAQSLRTAKLKMIKEGVYAHPMYWSPFILIGK